MTTSLRSKLTGTFTLEELDRMTWPVAWSCTKDKGEAFDEEAELHDLVREAKEQLQQAYDHNEKDDAEFKVKIEAGEVVEIVNA
jgi:predicted GIY-YIG superfamily endonuclease